MQDLRYAARTLLKSPAFTAVAVLTLALGIGANTAIFSVVDGVLLRPAPFTDIDRLMMVWETDRNSGTTREPASLPDFLDFRERSRTFDALAGFSAGTIALSGSTGDPVQAPLVAFTEEFLPVLGIRPILGRAFTADEIRPGGASVVLLSESVWERRYARSPDVIGQTVLLDGEKYEIVGVMPDDADFGLVDVLSSGTFGIGLGESGARQRIAVWLPLQRSVEDWPRYTHPLLVLGRLAPGATVAAARQEMTEIAAELEAAYPENDARGVNIEPLEDVVFGAIRPALLVLLAAVGLVLLVACANVANLLLARAIGRGREVAIRASVGAGAGRLARLFLIEGLLLSLAGAAAGIALAFAGTELLLALAPPDVPRLAEVGIDARVLAVTLAISLAVGVAFGLLPIVQARRVDVQGALRSDSPVGGERRRSLLQSGLIVAELAFAVILVVGAGLLLESFRRILEVDPGFRTDGVLKAEFTLPEARYPIEFSQRIEFAEVQRFNNDLLQRTRALPGVESVALASSGPLDRGSTNSFVVIGREAESAAFPEISTRSVSADYFATVGLEVRAGRTFDAGDDQDAPAVAVINEAAARLAFPDRNALGQRIAFWGIERRIVGVVANEKFHGVTAPAPIALYTPLAQLPSPSGNEVLLARSSGGSEALAAPLRDIVRDLDPELPVYGVEPLRRTLGRSIAGERFTMLLLGTFAAVAIVLALIGIHGVLAYLVARRTREMGIRLALGAERRSVLLLVARQGARLALAGLTLGLLGALAATRLLDSLLYGVTAADPATFAAVAAFVFAAAMLATFVPARRATRVAPLEALRHE